MTSVVSESSAMHCGKHPSARCSKQVVHSLRGHCGDRWRAVPRRFPAADLLIQATGCVERLMGFDMLPVLHTRGAIMLLIQEGAAAPATRRRHLSKFATPSRAPSSLSARAPLDSHYPARSRQRAPDCATPGPWARGPLASRYQALRGIAARHTIPTCGAADRLPPPAQNGRACRVHRSPPQGPSRSLRAP